MKARQARQLVFKTLGAAFMCNDAMRKKSTHTLEIYKLIREQIQHEDNLINHRLTWLIAIEAFLFVALTSLITAQNTSRLQRWLAVIIAVFGLTFPVTSMFNIHGALASLEKLRNYWYRPTSEIKKSIKQMEDWRNEVDESTGFPPIMYVGGKVAQLGVGAYGIPAVIIMAWVCIIVISIVTDFWKDPPSTATPTSAVVNVKASSVFVTNSSIINDSKASRQSK